MQAGVVSSNEYPDTNPAIMSGSAVIRRSGGKIRTASSVSDPVSTGLLR
jgi:hypothetical protein